MEFEEGTQKNTNAVTFSNISQIVYTQCMVHPRYTTANYPAASRSLFFISVISDHEQWPRLLPWHQAYFVLP